MRVLVVEDDDNLRQAISRYVSRHTLHVDEAANALDAVSLILEHPPDVLIADWDLGEGLTGVDVANFAHKHSPDTRIAMISGKSIQQLRAATGKLPVHIFLAKPFGLHEMSSIFT